MTNQIPIMITVAEAANITHCTPYSIRKMVKEGHVRYVLVGVKVLINQDSLFAYLNNENEEQEVCSNEL